MQNAGNKQSFIGSALAVAVMFVAVCALLVGCGGTTAGSSESAKQMDAVDAAQAPLDTSSIRQYAESTPTGSLNLEGEVDEPRKLTETEAEEVNRAVRDYEPIVERSLLINNAKHFYYYEQLSEEEQAIYRGLYQLMSDPTNENAVVSVQLKENVDTKEFNERVRLGMLAVQYDHPEFFWAYNGLETKPSVAMLSDRSNECYFMLGKPYKRYEKEMNAFNAAVDDFLKDIDLTEDDYQIARAIHDKLIGMVTYDQEVADSGENDLAHTAYGALVENSSGKAHYAVSDGYAQAYVYLLQQAGIDAAVVLGAAGNTKSDAAPHTWTVAKLGGEWYEIDPTWDDQSERWKSALDAVKQNDPNNENIPYFEKALADAKFCGALDHFLCNVTTSEIADYKPKNLTEYVFPDGKVIQLVDASVHIRANDLTGYDGVDRLMKLAPTATGTKHAYVK